MLFLNVIIIAAPCYIVHGEHPNDTEIHRSSQTSNSNSLGRRIVGGDNADISDFPFVVSIQHNGKHTCGGSIITARWILTASHCIVDDGRRESLTVSAGTALTGMLSKWIWFSSGQVRYPSQFILHANYNSIHHLNDIGLLSITRPFYQTTTVLPLSLPMKSLKGTDAFMGRNATVIGWGLLSATGPETSRLHKVTLPIIKTSECRNAYFNRYQPDRMFVCTLVPNKDACTGDSGGPLLLGNVQVGIVVYGIDCAHSHFPGVYTRVDTYLDWIRANAFSHCCTSSYNVLIIACALAVS